MAATIYTNCSVLGLGCFLYQDAGLTTPVANGEYSNGTDVFTVSGGAGEITATSLCSTPTTSTTTSTTTGASTTTTTTTTTTAPAGVTVTTVTGGWTDDGFGNFTPNCFVAINTTYPFDITFDTQVDLASGGVYNFNTTILAGNLNGTGTGGTYGGFPTGVNNACIISCDTPAIVYTGFNCYTTQFLVTNGSVDVAVTNVVYNGSSPTYLGGQPLPNTTGNGTDLWFGFIGAYLTLDVSWSASVAGQHITVTDSLGTVQCQNIVGVGSGTLSFTNVYFDGTNVVIIDVQDGTC